ncbi:DUF2637 domain-containing protein [Streptomyces viridosporus]|uniref:DUF2637 domain-containing protein n=1 Tax=Streptomyces viridosporus TaxID=67581 RepID=UPI0033189E0A
MKPLVELTPAQLRSIERTLSAGTWTITAGAVLFSVLTVTPLVQRVTPKEWDWTAPILPIVVDAAVVIVIRLDATVSRLGEKGGRWPDALRWLTGAFTLALNVGDSALKGDAVGVAVHAVAPLLLIFTAEAALSYRRAIGRAQDRIARERAAEAARERAEREERERRQREEREAREQRAREERERERETRERLEREAREHELQKERERRQDERERLEWEAAQQRDREERERRDRLEREERERQERERERREAAEKAERERREREEREARERAEKAERERRERAAATVHALPSEHRERPAAKPVSAAANTGRPKPVSAHVNARKDDKQPEPVAREHVRMGERQGKSVRQMAKETGWSVGWISARVQEIRGSHEKTETNGVSA